MVHTLIVSDFQGELISELIQNMSKGTQLEIRGEQKEYAKL